MSKQDQNARDKSTAKHDDRFAVGAGVLVLLVAAGLVFSLGFGFLTEDTILPVYQTDVYK